jgi:replication factor C large subunit
MTKEMVGFEQPILQLKKFIDIFNQIKQEIRNLKDDLKLIQNPDEKKKIEFKIASLETRYKTNKARLLIGPPGVGKTTVVYALAHDLNYSVIEMNASDVRTEKAINQNLGETVKSNNLLAFTAKKSAGKIILLDEVDGLHGQSDKGGVAALEKIIDYSQFPIIMTCNFRDDTKFGNLYKLASPLIEIEKAKIPDIVAVLTRIAIAEDIPITEKQLEYIAKKAGGDLRSSINDLQAISQGGEKVEDEMLESLNMGRDTEIEVEEFLQKMFLTVDIKKAKQVLNDIEQKDVDFRNIHKWINENIFEFLQKPLDIYYAFQILANADHILGYINRTQDYSHLSYFFDILAGGIRFSKSDNIIPKLKVNSPRYFRIRAAADDDNAIKLQKLFHVSLTEILRELRPILQQFLKINPEFRQFLATKLNVEESKLNSVI